MNRRPTIRWIALVLVLVSAAGLWVLLDPGFRAPHQEPTASEPPAEEFEQRIRAYLLDNPEIIVEAMQRLEARRRAAAQGEARAILAARADEVFRDAASPVGGNPQGDVTLVEFFDYNCPYCRQVASAVSEAVAADEQLRVVYKEFPILGPNSVFAAKAALAAHRQERYIAFHQALMQLRGTANEEAVLTAAAKVGLDVERLRTDMQDTAIQTALDRNLALAAALRINGTPGFVIGDEILRGAADLKTLQDLVRKARGTR